MAEDTKKRSKGTKILLIGFAGMALFCCVPISCIGIIGSNSERVSQSLDEQIQDAETTRDSLKQANDARQEVTNNASQASSTSSNQSNDASLQTSDNGHLAVGEEFTLGDYTYKVTRWKTSTGLGNQFSTTKPVDGAIFVLVEYEITNNTNKTQTALTGDLKLIDDKGREFSTSSKVETALSIDANDQDFMISELQPGLKRTMQTGFEVPEDSIDAGKFDLIVPEKGLFGVGEVSIRLD